MAEYIEREKAIECIKPHVKVQTVYGEAYMQAIAHAVDILEIMPTANVQPVLYAEWEDTGDFYYKRCSKCKAQWIISLIDNRFFKLCPNCGAKMKKRNQ